MSSIFGNKYYFIIVGSKWQWNLSYLLRPLNSENHIRLCPVLEFSSSCFGQISLLICKPYLESPCQIYASDNIVLRGPPKTLPPLWVFFFFSSNVESSFFMLIGLLCSLVGFCFYPNTIFLEIENDLTLNCVDILLEET